MISTNDDAGTLDWTTLAIVNIMFGFKVKVMLIRSHAGNPTNRNSNNILMTLSVHPREQ